MNLTAHPPRVSFPLVSEQPLNKISGNADDSLDLEFTGERMIPGQVEFHLEAEHRARYEFAARNLPKGLVLDDGCGVGYGSAILAQHGLQVVGIDVDEQAIAACHNNVSSPAVSFQKEDSAHLSFLDESFDGVVSFEVIEHIADFRRYISEAHRVLRPEGILIISTPNKRVYTDIPQHHNPFHVHEFYLEEFRNLLGSFFPSVEIIGQWNAEAILIGPHPQTPAALSAGWLLRNVRVRDEAADPLEDAGYFLAICHKKRSPNQSPRTAPSHCFVTGLSSGSVPPVAIDPAPVAAKTQPDTGPVHFRQGFYEDEGGWRWIGPVAKLRVPAASTPARITFNLTASKLAFYENRPLQIQLTQNKEWIRTETFTRDEEAHCIELIVPHSDRDATVELNSSSFFLPSRCGWPSDKRELSFRFGQFKFCAHGKAGVPPAAQSASAVHPASPKPPKYTPLGGTNKTQAKS